jgi:D-aminoacyl-tRNA deacylase
MKAVIQRVSEARVLVDEIVKGSINKGFCILLGIHSEDTEEDLLWLVKKILGLRIFSDENGNMNISPQECNAEYLVISQFTLYSSTKKGNRPSFIEAAKPDIAIPLYDRFIKELEFQSLQKVQKGVFGADMKVHLVNDGPVTIIIDTRNKE